VNRVKLYTAMYRILFLAGLLAFARAAWLMLKHW
jgi:hypothetical protein